MKVAVVFPYVLERQHLGKDVLLIPEGLRRAGVDVELHCPAAEADVDWPIAVVEADPGGLARREHFAGRGLDAAVVYSFLRSAPLLAAARAAGLRVVAKGDTSGDSVVRAHPVATLRHNWFNVATPAGRARGTAEWMARIGPLAGRDHRELTDSLSLADVTVVETDAARAAVRSSLARRGDERLLDRVRVVSNPIADVFTTAPVHQDREKIVVAVGRWDLAQKDAPLLRRTLERFQRARPDYSAVVIGAGGRFGPGVEHAGRVTQAEIVATLGRARTMVVTSRWESFSLASYEALALGCSVVGPPLAPLRNIVDHGPFGTLASRHAADLSAALDREGAAWDRGERQAPAIAAHWRGRLDVGTIGREYARLLAG